MTYQRIDDSEPDTGRRFSDEEVISLAQGLFAALSEGDEFTFIQGGVEDRHTLVDGTFDLLAITARALSLAGWEGGEKFLTDRLK